VKGLRISRIAIGVALIAGLVPTLAFGASQTVTLSAHVNATVAVASTSDGLTIKANTPWKLVVQTTDGTVTHNGQKTAGTTISLPDDTVAYWIAGE